MYFAAKYSITAGASPVEAMYSSRSSRLNRWVSPSAGFSLRLSVDGLMSMSAAIDFEDFASSGVRCAM